ncbi:hypothetical protein SODALDRAFT_335326 [Sodiomyces alkalinus F11]|uniref:Uncharacterized protein n=1 Tax=Sodiomyces alkalinus (strain CBS 110278 / VKM F-3762 / F11) TaxID=1314773 RepID=A0A3N2PP02_SODAK|nr:hypothetical protein SODALDRAFT_335326 [Sodiomyces alkalinus F11]ROT36248.1 hypothetical protein SODALDRAFT_335326 [Sodiomyces alkalinus F11]
MGVKVPGCRYIDADTTAYHDQLLHSVSQPRPPVCVVYERSRSLEKELVIRCQMIPIWSNSRSSHWRGRDAVRLREDQPMKGTRRLWDEGNRDFGVAITPLFALLGFHTFSKMGRCGKSLRSRSATRSFSILFIYFVRMTAANERDSHGPSFHQMG